MCKCAFIYSSIFPKKSLILRFFFLHLVCWRLEQFSGVSEKMYASPATASTNSSSKSKSKTIFCILIICNIWLSLQQTLAWKQLNHLLDVKFLVFLVLLSFLSQVCIIQTQNPCIRMYICMYRRKEKENAIEYLTENYDSWG